MRRTGRTLWLAAAISIAVAVLPAWVTADQSTCQKGVTSPGASDGSNAGGVNIHLTKDGTVWWCPASLIEAQSDIPDGTNYPYQANPSSPNTNQVSHAISVAKLLSLAGINAQAVGFTYVVRDNGTWSTLRTADLSSNAPFQDGLRPIVWINGTETDYLRPLRSSTDTNGNDFFSQQSGAPLDLSVSSGPLLQVKASAHPTKVARHKPVSFTASLISPTPGNGALSFTWNFADGTTGGAQLATHRFNAVGSYGVVVAVHASGNDAGGVSAPVTVTVGTPPKGGHGSNPAGSNRNKNAPSSGPKQSGGNQPAAQPKTQHTGGASTNGSGSNNPTTPSTATTPTSGVTPTTPVTPVTPVAPAVPVTPTVPPVRPIVPTRPRAPKTLHLPAAAPTTIVRGQLISDVIPVNPAQLATPTASPNQSSASSARLAGGSVTPVAGLVGGGVIFLLLGSGAGAELRSRRRPVIPARHG